jgi:hypothetical protein
MAKLSDIKKAFGTDKAKEHNGVAKTYPGTEIEVSIRRATHEIYRKELRKQYRRFKQLGDNMPPAVEDEIKMKAAATALVTGWNIEDQPCTPENVYQQFADNPDFYKWVEGEADQFENYRLHDVAEDADPLSDTSNGFTVGETKTSSHSSNDEQHEASQSKSSTTDQG